MIENLRTGEQIGEDPAALLRELGREIRLVGVASA
jgi:hypothetical protein